MLSWDHPLSRRAEKWSKKVQCSPCDNQRLQDRLVELAQATGNRPVAQVADPQSICCGLPTAPFCEGRSVLMLCRSCWTWVFGLAASLDVFMSVLLFDLHQDPRHTIHCRHPGWSSTAAGRQSGLLLLGRASMEPTWSRSSRLKQPASNPGHLSKLACSATVQNAARHNICISQHMYAQGMGQIGMCPTHEANGSRLQPKEHLLQICPRERAASRCSWMLYLSLSPSCSLAGAPANFCS